MIDLTCYGIQYRTLITRALIFLIAVMFPLLSFSQAGESNPFKVNLIPPSPEAAALAKYVDVPVSLYSGTPQISIPLYDLDERGLKLPISLSYHAAGNKVGTEATRVGLSWTLNAGGAITRSVRGWPDEFPVKGFRDVAKQHELADFAFYPSPAEERYPLYHAMASNCLDVEPDIFYFNFAGYSGKFMFNWDGEIEVDCATSLRIDLIETVEHQIFGFAITAPDGIAYAFFVSESSQPNAHNPTVGCDLALQEPIVSTWYLSQIASRFRETLIKFEYEPYVQVVRSWSMETQLLNAELANSSGAPSRQLSATRINGKQLKRITTSSGQITIDFLKGAQRTDLEGSSFTLGEILVKNKNNRTLRDWRFEYDYSTGRLTLKKLTEWGNTSSNPPYRISYHNVSLPPALSFAQDHWGFYNRNNAQTLIPAETVNRAALPQIPVDLAGADREPDAQRVMAGLLREIEYPTGGKDVLEFEPHDYSFLQSVELKDELSFPRSIQSGAPDSNTPPNTTDTDVIDFTLPTQTDIDFTGAFYYGMTFGTSTHPLVVSIVNKNTNQEIFRRSPGGPASPDPKIVTAKLIKVPAGTYSFIVQGKKPITSANGENYVSATISYNEGTGQSYTLIKQGGGVRIRKIRRSFGNGSPDRITRYVYRITEEGKEKSSGSLLESAFRYGEWIQYKESLINNVIPKYSRYSQNRSALGATHGSHVGYGSVTVLQGENGENGKTISAYTSPREVQDEYILEIPYPPAWSYDYKRGLLLTQEDYNSDGSLLRKIINEYSAYSKSIDAVKVGWKVPGDGPYGPQWIDRYAVSFYKNILGYPRLKSTTETSYFPGDPGTPLRSFENRKKFVFNENPAHRQLVLTASTDSHNDSVFVHMKYPQDYPGEAAMDKLKSRSVLSEIIETISWKKSGSGTSLLSATRKDFTIHIMQGAALPSVVRGAQIADPVVTSDPVAAAQDLYEDRLQFIRYDQQNNILEHASSNGMRTSYIWDKEGTSLLAKADHATSGQIFYTSFEEDDDAVITRKRTGRKSLPVVGVAFSIPASSLPKTGGNYILSYWVREGNSWVYYEKNIDNYQPGNSIETHVVSGYMDDIRLHPKDAVMTTFTYEPFVGITSVTDANNITIYFEYDDFNRLKCKLDQDFNILECYEYKYQEEVAYAVENNQPETH